MFFLVEFFLNQILISWKHIVYQYLFTAFYAGITALWQVVTKNAVIFPKALDWICATRDGAPDDCIVSQCIVWFVIFMAVQTAMYSLVLLMHYLKSKYSCKQSVPIVTYQRDSIKTLGSIMASKRE